MNLQLLKIFYEVALCGSLNKVARHNYVSASNLSRSIKTIEDETNLVLFKRTRKGMELTHSGEDFLSMVEPILKKYSQLESIYLSNSENPQILKLTLCVHQNSLATQCLVDFYNKYSSDSEYIDIIIDSFHSMDEVVKNMKNKFYMLGVVQYSSNLSDEKEESLRLNGMEILASNRRKTYVVLGKNHPLANRDILTMDELKPYTRVAFIDEKLPDIDYCADLFDFNSSNIHRRILIKERGQIDNIVASTDGYFLGGGNNGIEVLVNHSPCVSIPIADTDIRMVTAIVCRKNEIMTRSAKRYAEMMIKLFKDTEE